MKIKHLYRILYFSAFAMISLMAMSQSRLPEIKVPDRVPDKHETDSLNLEERPYFLLIDQSEKALQEGDYEAAALRLVEAMGIEPDNELNVALLSNLGMIYFYNEQDSLALVVLEKAIERAPRLIAPREGRARILTSLKRDREALEEYGNILAIDSINTNARFMHGLMSLYDGKLEEAKRDIAVLEEIIPVSTKTTLAQAILYSLTGCEIEAISLFRKLIDREPAPEYFSRMTACQLAIDNLADASETIGKWLQLYPHDAEAFYFRAVLNKKRYLAEDAFKDAQTAIKLGADKDKVMSIFE